MNDELLTILKNIPTILSQVNELNLLLTNLPKESSVDLTVTAGKTVVKINRDKDVDLYRKIIENVNSGSVAKAYKIRDYIDMLLYPKDGAQAMEATK